ncbi:hypothetical protein PHYBOEH_009929 [Phytophthora boehmeriae]|uniref:Uncharacterized protein n=1 Tax=Phytophthora boehmeriae TaxID=109152 RepID=A0A8T1X3Q7_9STRA|nr:hypothetical protein PHYBOEH_009929 [Phytophthora boehmeriae]
MESKNYFEEYFDGCQDSQSKAVEAARDYIYVLLQCNLPSLALSRCSQFLSQFEDDHSAHGNAVMVVSMLLLHMYKADSLLCLERVDECHDYLKQIVQPKIQLLLQQSSRSSTGQTSDATFVEVVSCHTQLLNNLAVVTVCCDGIDAAIAILREGLQQYPDCLALKFNLVLLLWRKGDKTVACSMWVEARGWTLTTGPTGVNPLSVVSSYENAAASVSPSETPLISEHVQSDSTGDGNVSEQQLAYLDALILNHWRKIRNAKLEATSLQYVEYFENLGNSHSIQLDVHHN